MDFPAVFVCENYNEEYQWQSDLIIHFKVGDPSRRNFPGPDPCGSAGLGDFRESCLDDGGSSSEVPSARRLAGHHVDTTATPPRDGLVVVCFPAVTMADISALLEIDILRSKNRPGLPSSQILPWRFFPFRNPEKVFLDWRKMSFWNSLSPILPDLNLLALSPSPHWTCRTALSPRGCHPDRRDPKIASPYSVTQYINERI